MTLRLALLGDVDGELVPALDAAGFAVAGALAADPLALSPRSDAVPPPRAYGGLAEVVSAARGRALDAAVLPPDSPLAAELPALVRAGLPVLLSASAPWDPDVLRQAREHDVPVAVLLRERARGWALAVGAATAGAAEPPVQVTVRGWPRGPAAAAELVDLLRAWCGEVVAAAAVPAPLPAPALPDGPRVAWALLSDRGVTVLVAHDGAGPAVRVSFAHARLLAGPPAQAAWQGGSAVPVLAPPDPLAATCRTFALAVGDGTSGPLGRASGGLPEVADLADLLPTARVLAALRQSARVERWVELG